MSKILEQVRMSYYGARSMISPDGHTLTLLSRVNILRAGMAFTLQIQITEKSREEYQFLIYGLGSLDLIERTDGHFDAAQIASKMKRFNSSHNKPISLGMDGNGDFLMVSSTRFYGFSGDATFGDADKICNYVRDMVEFFEDKYEDIKGIVKYFG